MLYDLTQIRQSEGDKFPTKSRRLDSKRFSYTSVLVVSVQLSLKSIYKVIIIIIIITTTFYNSSFHKKANDKTKTQNLQEKLTFLTNEYDAL